jgi:hypothetical protein
MAAQATFEAATVPTQQRQNQRLVPLKGRPMTLGDVGDHDEGEPH